MKALLKPVLAAGLVLAAVSPLTTVPAAAQQVIGGIGIVDVGAIIRGTSAFKTAEQQRPVTYKARYDQAKLRNDQINAQLKPMVEKFQADRTSGTVDNASLQAQNNAMEQIDQQGQRELAQILAPVVLSQEYVDEQIKDVLPQAIENAAKKRKTSLILRVDSGAIVYREQGYNMNQDVITELDALLPVAQLVPPEGWLPAEMREQLARAQAAQQGITGEAPAAAPAPQATTQAGPPVEGR